MSARDEEDARIDAMLAEADFCQECGTPIGVGRCDGCLAVAAAVDDDLFFDAEVGAGEPQIVLHPHPVPCRGCGMLLQATYAERNGFACPNCGRQACYTCGCVEDHACSVTVTSADGARSLTYACWWIGPGACSFCMHRAAYELYQRANGEPATDPYYMSLGRTSFGVKGLHYGIGDPSGEAEVT